MTMVYHAPHGERTVLARATECIIWEGHISGNARSASVRSIETGRSAVAMVISMWRQAVLASIGSTWRGTHPRRRGLCYEKGPRHAIWPYGRPDQSA